MNIVKIAMIEALIDEIANRNGNIEKFPSLNILKEKTLYYLVQVVLRIYILI